MVVAQVSLKLPAIKGHFQFTVLLHSTDVAVLRECAIGMQLQECPQKLLPVQFSTNRPHTCNSTAHDLHIQHLYLQDRLRPAARTAAADSCHQRISAKPVRNGQKLSQGSSSTCSSSPSGYQPDCSLSLCTPTSNGVRQFGEEFSSRMDPGFPP